ncbi:androglobin [Lampris incognitus]|uniref:androglobin n=1 Tax=Lampris incognitus TaxID=2546036 RepID=UPI0024B5389C|nr:androglobin [Lampris incognitus]
MSKTSRKKRESTSRATSSQGPLQSKEAASLVASATEVPGDVRRCRLSIWPEWSEAEVNGEKWDSAKGVKDAKMIRSPLTVSLQFFEDPEGKICMPPSLKVHSWKRPSEFIVNKGPAVVESESAFDLISPNDHLICSELMRGLISELYIVWKLCNSTAEEQERWKPWEHIYSLCKVVKGHVPLYNVYGKYVVRLYWMGHWRKLMVDDAMPFDKDNNLLLPASTSQSELWPMLLSKALIKVANTDIVSGPIKGMGEFNFIHALTGWIPEILPIQSRYMGQVWELLKDTIPEFTYPGEEEEEEERLRSKDSAAERDSQLTDHKTNTPVAAKSPEKARDGREASHVPEIVICARIHPLLPLNEQTTVLHQMVDSLECLRRYGLSQLSGHIVLVARTRACPLEPPAKPISVPRWKLIRPRKETLVTDEPSEPPVLKAEQFIEVSSPFLSSRMRSSISPVLELCVTAEDSKKDDDATSIEQNVVDEEVGSPSDRHKKETKEPNPPQSGTPNLLVPDKPMLQETWVDLDDFAKCFRTLLVFHKPHTYPNHFHKSNFKHVIYVFHQCPVERGSHYLYVDSLQPSRILVSFSALLHWGETIEGERESSAMCRSGVLLAQPHSWKSLQSQLPVLCIKTTSSKAALLSLPPGRHVLCIHAQAALGYNIHLYSMEPFIFGDEETIMPHLTKESLHFSEQASSILRALGSAIVSFSQEQTQPAARRILEEIYCPQNIHTALERWTHHRVLKKAVCHMLSEALSRELTAEERFAVQALTADPLLFSTDSREHSSTSEVISAPPGDWGNRQPTDKEIQAVITLQAGFKGRFARLVLNASKPGTKENLTASKTLSAMWRSVESDAEKYAAAALRYILSHSESTAGLYPCQQDETTRIAFSDYSVPIQETANSWVLVFREVFLVPKEMLVVPKVYSPVSSCLLSVIDNDTGEEQPRVFNKVVPHIYRPNKLGYTFVAGMHLPEIPLVGAKWTMRLIGSREPLPDLARGTPLNKFSMKEFWDYYIPNDKNVICRYSVTVTADHVGTVQFQTSKPDVLIRLSILDHEKEVASSNGKGHVLIPVFQFQSNGTPSCGAPIAEKKQNQESSSTQQKKVRATGAPQGGGGQEGMAGQTDPSTYQKPPPTETMITTTNIVYNYTIFVKGHKYIVQTEVLCNSWALDDSQLAFACTLRDLEKNETKGYGGDRVEPGHSSSAEITSSNGFKPGTSKSNSKGKGDKDKERPAASFKPDSRPETSMDRTKAHWTLRVVSEPSEADSIEVRKDTERADKIKAMKQAWETAEPGRSVKALRSRLKFLNRVQGGVSDDNESQEPGPPSLSPVFSPNSSEQEKMLVQPESLHPHIPTDYRPFIRRQRDSPVLMNPEIKEHQLRKRSEQIQSYQLLREMVLEHRKQEALSRSELKRHQLEMYDNMQVALREKRKKFVDALMMCHSRQMMPVKGKQEEEQVLESVQQADLEKTAATAATAQPSTKPSKANGKKK